MNKLLVTLVLLFVTPLSIARSIDKDLPPEVIHLPSADQDFMCGMIKYGTEVDLLGQFAVRSKVTAVLERAEIVYHPFRHLLRKTFPFLHIHPAYPVPDISFDMPGELEVAGYYDTTSNHLNFNPVYLNKFTWEFIENVVVHESAHEVDYFENQSVYDKNPMMDPHGESWKRVMYELGAKNDAPYHTYTFCDLPTAPPAFQAGAPD